MQTSQLFFNLIGDYDPHGRFSELDGCHRTGDRLFQELVLQGKKLKILQSVDVDLRKKKEKKKWA